MGSKSSSYEPSAPPLPAGIPPPDPRSHHHHENQPLIQGQGHTYGPPPPMPYGQISSYQQYMTAPPPPPPPAFGIPVWHEHQHHETSPEWSTGLCHCTADMSICCLGCLCPCILVGKIAEEMDDGMTSCLAAALIWYVLQQFTSCGCIYSCGYRRKLRAKYHLPAWPLPDCLVHWLCWHCAFCQEYRELHIRRIRGEAWSTRSAMAPPTQQSMTY
uniref:TSA: Wollemia nobilis Ref_Wollemi_Transcript_28746_1126 transcribed RNA sequence n=1 Tax=Wollemia nobilis TaxID=56998 RepID=A0A0C9RG50_9CONI